MRVAFADPPYLGCCKLYGHHHPDGRCWDDLDTHRLLIERLERDFDGWALDLSSTSLREILPLTPLSSRIMPWVKPFAAFKRNVSVAYAWEPVIVKPCRKPQVTGRIVMRDWIAEGVDAPNLPPDFVAESITLKKGLTGAKPKRFCFWVFEMLGLHPDDEFFDLFTGSGAVTRAWEEWRSDLLRVA